jgi:hypothetical protein
VGLSISWPKAGPDIGSGGHAITGWGDQSGNSTLTSNPDEVRVTDSDKDTGGDVQEYDYDSYTAPNPSGPNEGNGWYFDYSTNHPYIKHIITLCPTDNPSSGVITQKVVGSYMIHQDKKTANATDLHYDVSTDTNILSYRTMISWQTKNSPTIVEAQPRRKITVDWDLSDNPVPHCTWVAIFTEFVLPRWNAVKYNNVHFTYPDDTKGTVLPKLNWEVITPDLAEATNIPNVTGGYVIGAFDILSTDTELPPEERIVAYHRLIHEYSFNQSPENHTLLLTGERGYAVSNFRFGHSYGYLNSEDLWEFQNWMTEIPKDEEHPLDEEEPIEIPIDWTGRLPYPEGDM